MQIAALYFDGWTLVAPTDEDLEAKENIRKSLKNIEGEKND